MIEVAVSNYLAEKNIDVYMEFPKNPPKSFVVLQLADGGCINHIDAATFFVGVYADTLYKTAELKEKVKGYLLDAISLPSITKSELGQERAGTDNANSLYKYDLTFNFYYYREET